MINEKGNDILDYFHKAKEEYTFIGKIRGIGMSIGIELLQKGAKQIQDVA